MNDFDIETKTHLICLECGNERTVVEHNSSIRVDSINNNTLEEALKKLSEEEELEGIDCPICQQKTHHYRKNEYGQCRNLIIGINRNQTLENGMHFKLNKSFEFPLELTWENQQMELSGFVLHSGTTQAGHYTSVIKDSKGKWWKCNDKKVVEYNIKRVKEDGFGTMYHSLSASILFYKPVEYVDTEMQMEEEEVQTIPEYSQMKVIYVDKQLYSWFENYYTKTDMVIPKCNELLFCLLSSELYSTFSKVGTVVEKIKFSVDIHLDELPIVIKDAITNKTTISAASKWITMQEKTTERKETVLKQLIQLIQQFTTPQQYAAIAKIINALNDEFLNVPLTIEKYLIQNNFEQCQNEMKMKEENKNEKDMEIIDEKKENKEISEIVDQAITMLEYLCSMQKINEQTYSLILALTSVFHLSLSFFNRDLLQRIIIIPEEKYALRDLKITKEKYTQVILKSLPFVDNSLIIDYIIGKLVKETNKQIRSDWRIMLQTIQKEIHDTEERNKVVQIYMKYMENKNNKNLLNESFTLFTK